MGVASPTPFHGWEKADTASRMLRELSVDVIHKWLIINGLEYLYSGVMQVGQYV
jgi:hypothetical protein